MKPADKLMTPGSIPKLALRRTVLEKDPLRLFPIGKSSLPIVVAQPDKKPTNRTQKSALRWCG